MKKILIALFAVAVLIALFAVMLPRIKSRKPVESGTRENRTEVRPAGFSLSEEDSIVLGRIARTRPERKVVVIGLDAATWNILDPMIERGQLPTFAKLLENSSYGILRSLVLQVTPPAWTSMFSGCLPWQTGIYGFGKLDTTTWTMQPVSSHDVRVPMIWDMASQAGLRTAVINVPVTYPVKEINGIMATGMLTDELVLLKQITPTNGAVRKASRSEIAPYGAASYSEPRKAELKIHKCAVTAYLLDDANDGTSSPTKVLFRVHEFSIDRAPLPGGADSASVTVPEQTAVCGMEQYTPWLKVWITYGGKPAQGWVRLSPKLVGPAVLSVTSTPVYGNVMCSTVPCCYPDSLKKAIAGRFERYTPFVSYVVPTLPDNVNDSAEYLKFFYEYDDWDLFIFHFQVTDIIQHWDGEDAYTQDVYLRIDKLLADFISRLPENTVLLIASDHGARGYRFKVCLNTWFDSMHLIARDRTGGLDTQHSIAFHMYWGIYINEKELEQRWSVIPGFAPVKGKSLYDAFVDFLVAKGKTLTHPNSELPLPVTLMRPPKNREHPSPDLIVQPEYADYAVHHEDMFHVGQDMILTPIQEGKKYSHRRAGMYIISGPGIKKANKTDVKNIYDITPTILYILGLPSADYFDGQIIRDVFEEEFLAGNEPARIHSYRLTKSEKPTEDQDREALEEKLRAIGYIQ